MARTSQGEIIVTNFSGINVQDNPLVIDDSECQIATNIVVNNGAVEIRGGFESHSTNGAVTGGITMMVPYYKRDGTEQLIFANDDDYYYITPASTTWQTIGDYGTAVDNPSAYQYKDILVFGTGSTANTPKKWDGSSFSNITTRADNNGDLRFYTTFLGKNAKYLIGSGLTADVDDTHNLTTVYYTSDPDNWSGGGVIQVGPSDGQDITGLIQNNNLVIQKEKARHYWDEFYEESGGTFALREFGVERSAGGANHETIVVIDGDVVSLTGKGRSIEGFGLEGTAQGNARPKQYATYINPILNNINWQKSIISKARGAFFDRNFFVATPYLSSQSNNLLFVGDWDSPTRNGQPSWTTWTRAIGSMAIFRDSNGVDQLYLGDALQPVIYKYDNSIYSDNGLGFSRQWRSKKFALGRQTDYDQARYVVIEGYMKVGTELTLKIIVDGSEQGYLITDTQLVTSSTGGGYIGERVIGDELVGGNGSESSKFRYQAVAEIPNSLRYGKNIEIDLSNSGAGQFWSMDYLSINEKINYANIPANNKNLTAI